MPSPTSAIEPIGSATSSRVNLMSALSAEPAASAKSMELAASLAKDFGPNGELDSKIPDIAKSLDALRSAKAGAQSADAFKQLAMLLGAPLPESVSAKDNANVANQSNAYRPAARPGRTAPTEQANIGGKDEGDLLTQMIRRLMKIFGPQLVQRLLSDLGLKNEEISALMGTGGTEQAGAAQAASVTPTALGGAVQFNRG